KIEMNPGPVPLDRRRRHLLLDARVPRPGKPRTNAGSILGGQTLKGRAQHKLIPMIERYDLVLVERMQNAQYAARAHVTKGYLAFLGELLGDTGKADAHCP